jgi:hypothetical protein
MPHRAASVASTKPRSTNFLTGCSSSRGKPWLVLGAAILRWTPSGCIERTPPPSSGRAVLITPQSSSTVLRTGRGSVVPLLHPTVLRSFAA